MSRLHLYKAKRKDGQGWIEGDFLHNYMDLGSVIKNSTFGYIQVYPDTLREFTSAIDKAGKGKKIFEGAIVRHHFGDEIGIVKFGKYCQPFNDDKFTIHIGYYVEWVLGYSKDTLRKDLGYWANIEGYDVFVGNIWDNKELLIKN